MTKQFYFTGGTVLAEYYLKHRYSEDLDFFSETKFDQQTVLTLMNDWSKVQGFTFTSRFAEVVYRFDLTYHNGLNYKVDFGYYPYRRIEEGKIYKSIQIDSLRDIATNKLLTLGQRTDAKDFVDIYFILKSNYSMWDLFYSLEVKFKQIDFDIMLIIEDLLKVEDFQALPRMIKPLTLEELKNFFRKLALDLGKKTVE